MESIRFLVLVSFALGVTISSLIVTVQVRRRMKRSLGRSATSLELVSMKTWMKVEEAEELEQQRKESGPIHPK